MSKIKTTCAVVITDGKKMLVCHPTGHTNKKCWSFPKGIMEEGEAAAEAAVRETAEETSIQLQKEDLRLLAGRQKYRKKRNIVVYVKKMVPLPDPGTLSCESNIDGSDKPEVDDYKIIDIMDYKKCLSFNLRRIFAPLAIKVLGMI